MSAIGTVEFVFLLLLFFIVVFGILARKVGTPYPIIMVSSLLAAPVVGSSAASPSCDRRKFAGDGSSKAVSACIRTSIAARSDPYAVWTSFSPHDLDGQGNGTVVEPRLYQLIRQPDSIPDPIHDPIRDRQFEIEFLDSGVEAFDFTFG